MGVKVAKLIKASNFTAYRLNSVYFVVIDHENKGIVFLSLTSCYQKKEG